MLTSSIAHCTAPVPHRSRSKPGVLSVRHGGIVEINANSNGKIALCFHALLNRSRHSIGEGGPVNGGGVWIGTGGTEEVVHVFVNDEEDKNEDCLCVRIKYQFDDVPAAIGANMAFGGGGR